MKKNTLTTILIACSLILVGITISFISFASVDFDYKRLSTFSNESAELMVQKVLLQEDDTVFIQLQSKNISIDVSPDNFAYFKYTNCYRYLFDFTQDAKKTSLVQKHNPSYRSSQFSWLDIFRFDVDFYEHSMSDVKVLLPKSFRGCLEIQSASGKKIIKNICPKELRVPSTSGKIELSDVVVDHDIVLSGISGTIEVNSLMSTNGSITIDGSSSRKVLKDLSAEDVRVSSISGSIEADTIIASNLSLQGTSGRTALSNSITNETNISTVSGSIHLDNCTSAHYNVSSTSGRVSGTIVGKKENYMIQSQTTSGRNDLGFNTEAESNQSIVVTTISGSIDIGFTE